MRKMLTVATIVAASTAALPLYLMGSSSSAGTPPAAFTDARLKIEYNSTDGDAGLQVFLDGEPWNQIKITKPKGETVVEVEADGVIRKYGLTELFSESSEPPFEEFPFAEFKKLFPEGRYTFTGRTIDGQRLRNTFRLTHAVPDGPVIVSPTMDAVLGAGEVVMRWNPVTTPAGVDVVAYQLLVVEDTPFVGNPKRVLDVMLPGSATRFPVPAEFLRPGTYKGEVLAIELSGNQTLTEVAFTVR